MEAALAPGTGKLIIILYKQEGSLRLPPAAPDSAIFHHTYMYIILESVVNRHEEVIV